MRVRGKFLLIASGCLMVSLIVAWSAPNLLRRRMADCHERSAPQELRQIDEAIRAYITKHGTAPPTLSSLRGRIASELSCGTLTCDSIGYRFQYTVASQDSGPRYFLSARPVSEGIAGVRSYYLDQTGVLRCTREARATTSNDPPMRLCGN
jgi:hypothetical protein